MLLSGRPFGPTSSQLSLSCDTTERGLDHGVWAGFHVAFHSAENPPRRAPCPSLPFPFSVPRTRTPTTASAVPSPLSATRASSSSVPACPYTGNLHHMDSGPEPLPYAVSCDDALKEAAHPWMDHLVPVHVAAGAAQEDLGKQAWTMKEGTFAWAQYRFGSLSES
ncbi:hypothetical protein CTA2_4207 [Colletotrichum tanaceti]|uniref:Uncharacterized protein n=1 Tax=Colletotrichum tanaceti TaxID=1306861 RepID=A0A4U6XCW2_9PEZI|nr:hypothetical protein CTA2_4207 [Colletotrichum tanaceti]TKW51657.1 hypothetical protein CTA1_12605 [Colletotrichum tanaceti]